jgi:CDP-diacylglycerol--serine O-phosphatidyltransferase
MPDVYPFFRWIARGGAAPSLMTEEPDSSADPSGAAASRVRASQAAYLPNILTLCAVLCGMTALRLSGEGQPELAMAAIFAAVVLDTADGYLARLLRAESPIGAELDSLADFVNFGVAPAMLMYQRDLHLIGWTGWIIAAVYVLAAGMRLARFNVQAKSLADNKPSRRFLGLPTTGAAVAVLIADGAANAALAPDGASLVTAGAAVAASALMVSRLKVPAPFKRFGARNF